MIFVFDFDRFGAPFWCHFGSPNGAKKCQKIEKKRDQKQRSSPRGSKTPLKVVLGRSWGGSGGSFGRIRGGFWVDLELVLEPLELQKAVQSNKKKLELQKAATRNKHAEEGPRRRDVQLEGLLESSTTLAQTRGGHSMGLGRRGESQLIRTNPLFSRIDRGNPPDRLLGFLSFRASGSS